MDWEQEAVIMSDGPSLDELFEESGKLEDVLRDRYDRWVDIYPKTLPDGDFEICVEALVGKEVVFKIFGEFSEVEAWVDGLFGEVR
jgi:hypothetical protein